MLAALGLAAVAITYVLVLHDPPVAERASLFAGWSIFLLSYCRRPGGLT